MSSCSFGDDVDDDSSNNVFHLQHEDVDLDGVTSEVNIIYTKYPTFCMPVCCVYVHITKIL